MLKFWYIIFFCFNISLFNFYNYFEYLASTSEYDFFPNSLLQTVKFKIQHANVNILYFFAKFANLHNFTNLYITVHMFVLHHKIYYKILHMLDIQIATGLVISLFGNNLVVPSTTVNLDISFKSLTKLNQHVHKYLINTSSQQRKKDYFIGADFGNWHLIL